MAAIAAGTGNRIHDNALGVLVGTQGATIANNIPRDNFVAGLFVIRDCSRVTGPPPCFSSQNQFLHNVFTGVSTPLFQDCRDETVGSATAGTADTWLDNTGATTSFPAGICLP